MDAHTLVVINLLFLVLYAAMAVVYRTTHRQDQPGWRGTDWFIACHLSLAAAILLTLVARRLGHVLTSVLIVPPILVAHLLLHRGFAELLERGRELWRVQVGLISVGLAAWLFLIFFPSSPATQFLIAIVGGIQYGVTGLMLFRTEKPGSRVAAGFAGAAVTAYALCHFLRLGGATLHLAGIGEGGPGWVLPTMILLAHGAIAYAFLMVASSRLSMRLERQAHVDELTGLMNLRAIRKAAAKAIVRCRRKRVVLSVVMIDLDGLKDVNDRLGHEAGDALLRAAAKTLVGSVREKDKLARVGGDEFCLLLPGANEEEAVRLAERCRSRLMQIDVPYRGNRMQVSGSFGVAQSVDFEVNWEELLRRSDAALYRAKRDGGNCVAVGDRTSPAVFRNQREHEDQLQRVS